MSDFEKFDMTKHVPVTYGNSTNVPAQASDEPMLPDPVYLGGDEAYGDQVYGFTGDQMRAMFRAGQAATQRTTADVERDAARFDFMMRVADNPEGAEAMAVEAIGNESMETDRPESIQMRELIDAAIAATKGAKP